MERKKYNRGTVTGGITQIVVAAIAVFIAILVLVNASGNKDADDKTGRIFMFVIGFIMLGASGFFVYNGVRLILDGKKSFEVARKGHPENGKILDLSETLVTENNNGVVYNYTVYNLKFEYTDDDGKLCESKEQISKKAYEQLQERTLVPILVYGERAIFDKKRLDNEK